MSTTIRPVAKSDILFIINPNAGKKNIHKIIHQLSSPELGIRYIVTKDIADVDRILKNEINQNKVFVAVGGDGTVSAISKHLVFTDKVLAVLPCGSGNGFANEMGFQFDLHGLIAEILRGEIIEVDVLHVNHISFINMAGIGFDAEVVHRLRRVSKNGLVNYMLSALQAYRAYKPIEISISGRGVSVHGKYFMVSIANTRQFGNHAIISPRSRPDDGQFEIICVKPLSFLNLLKHAAELFYGRLKPSIHLHYFTCNETIHIQTDAKKIHLDGEPLAGDGNYEIGIMRRSLKVVKASGKKNPEKCIS